ncbi:MAG: polysaccharide deacetylase family protein [Deltaproteobacteria bacterium]|nr:polysaccharide deacetylase family protein [Deltaproteobacteria bacterium]
MICPLSPAHLVALVSIQWCLVLLVADARLAALPLLAFLVLCVAAPFFPGFRFFLPLNSRGKGVSHAVALTFDNGPDPEVTPRLIDLLALHHAPATFFVTGAKAERHPDLVREVLSRGHTIGNHSYSASPLLMLWGKKAIRREIEATQRVLEPLGIFPLAFRPPLGIHGPSLWPILLDLGMSCVNFRLRASDRGNRQIPGLAARVLRKCRNGDVIRLRDAVPAGGDIARLLEEFGALLRGLREKGVEIVPLAQLIGKEVMLSDERERGPTPTAQFYNDLAPTYDHEQFCTAVSLSKRKEQELFSARLPEIFAGKGRVLEVGAGTGIYTLPIARHSREVLAVDVSRNMLRILEEKALTERLTNIKILLGDIEQCEPDGAFSVICAFCSFEYIADLPALIHRLALHLEPGGTLYCLTARRSLFRLFTQIGNAMRQGLWLRARSRREMERMLRSAGFEQIAIDSHLLRSWLSGGMLLEVVARKAAGPPLTGDSARGPS